MYFSNINNPELQHFHKTIGADFSMSLTEILSSDLFKVEPMSEDMYRVYPLFYCKNIISNNSSDKILDTQCLILIKQEHETYLSFITDNANSNVLIDESLLNIKGIDESLTMEEFNALVYQLRNTINLEGIISFEETSLVNGVYADYRLFADDEFARNDAGFIVNDNLKNNQLTVLLLNPFFLNARYVLTCTVRSLTGANICENESQDYKTLDTFSVELVENVPVALNLNDYVNDSILDFDMSISVSFDVPEIVNLNFELELNSNTDFVPFGETLTLTARLTGEDNVDGYIVEFFEDNQSIGSETTSNGGVAELEYISESHGNHVYSCNILGVIDSVNVRVGKYDSIISLTSDKSVQYLTGNYTLTGVLTSQNNPLPDTPVKLYCNNVFLEELTTDNNGTFTETFVGESLGSYNYQIVYEGDNTIYKSNANTNVTIRKINTNMTVNFNKTNIEIGDTLTITGKLTDEFNNPVSNREIVSRWYPVLNGQILPIVGTANTNNNGDYSISAIMKTVVTNAEIHTSFNADSTYNSRGVFGNVTVYKNKLTLTTDKTKYDVNEACNYSILLTDNNNNPVSNKQVKIYVDTALIRTATTDSQGKITGSFSNPSEYGTHTIKAVYAEGDQYKEVTNSITVTFKYKLVINTFAPTYSGYYYTYQVEVLSQINGSWVKMTDIPVYFEEFDNARAYSTNENGIVNVMYNNGYHNGFYDEMNIRIDETSEYYGATAVIYKP